MKLYGYFKREEFSVSSATVRHQRTGGGQGGVRSALMKEKKI